MTGFNKKLTLIPGLLSTPALNLGSFGNVKGSISSINLTKPNALFSLFSYEISSELQAILISSAIIIILLVLLLFLYRKRCKNLVDMQGATDNISDGILILDLKRNIRFANRKAASLLNYSREELNGILINSIIEFRRDGKALSSTELPIFKAMNDKSGKLFHEKNLEMVLANKTLPVNITASTIIAKNQIDGCLLIIRDLSDNKSAEEIISHWKKRYEFVSAAANQIVYDYNVESGEVKWSRSAQKVIGYKLNELSGGFEHWLSLIHQDDRHNFEKTIKSAIENCTQYEIEYRIKHKNGDVLFVRDEGMFLKDANRALGIIRDISEHKKAEEEILKFKNIFDNANHGAIITTLSGDITYINAYFANAHGYSPEELIGKNMNILHNQEQLNTVTRVKSELLKKGRFDAQEIWHTHRNGKTFPMLSSGILVKSNSGEPLYMAATSTDISEQIQFENALMVSEERYRTLISNIPGAVYRRKTDAKWSMNFISNEIFEICGYPAYDFVNNAIRSYSSIIYFDDKPKVGQTAYMALSEKKPYVIEYRIQHSDGSIRWVHEKGQGIFDKNDEVIWCDGVIIDITQRKIAEQALLESDERLKMKLDLIMSPDMDVKDVHLQDIVDINTVQKIIDDFSTANKVFCFILNSSGKLISKSNMLSDICGKAKIDFRISPDLISPDPYQDEKIKEHLNPKYVAFNSSGIVYASAPIIVANKYFASWIIGKVISVNDENRDMFQEKIDVDISEYIEGHDFARSRRQENFKNVIQMLTHIARELSALGFNNLKLAQEITERKTAEAKLQDSEKELLEANASKDKFFSIIAHDLKNPLAGLKGLTGMLNSNMSGFDTDELQEVIMEMDVSARHVYKLLEDLLNWSRSQTGKIKFNPDVVDLKIICDSNIYLLNTNAEAKNIDLHSEIGNSIYAFADANMITTVVRNLISNAVKFTPINGEIVVRAHDAESFIEISVNDNGVGMSNETLNKLFRIDENVTTLGTNQEKGTGLGLILCKEFVEQNSGRIWAESEEGSGSSFKFTLPKTNPET